MLPADRIGRYDDPMHSVSLLGLGVASDATGVRFAHLERHGVAGQPDNGLIAHGLDANPMHTDGFTPIHRACLGREPEHTETVRVLLKAGVPAEQKTADGKKPIFVTQNVETLELLRLLIKTPATTGADRAQDRVNFLGCRIIPGSLRV